MNIKYLQAIVFDLDGTLVDSRLDFDKMRSDLGFPPGVPILEHLSLQKDENYKKECHKIIFEHEERGVDVATLMPGVPKLLQAIKSKGLKTGLLTRNNSHVTKLTLEKFKLSFDMVFSREDCKPKPHPEGLLLMAKSWKVKTENMLYIGDFQFDLETAKNANAKSCLYLNSYNHGLKAKADYVLESYEALIRNLS
ncbi:MAG: phosphatase [Halobacteriovoraceae bacterium]|nr:phosphatase [Halobacteriovoraceae bacterium]|tara:strand:+ start:212 stop:796 length:585 start_codon:yes stop_codon:yes gene_type:complete